MEVQSLWGEFSSNPQRIEEKWGDKEKGDCFQLKRVGRGRGRGRAVGMAATAVTEVAAGTPVITS